MKFLDLKDISEQYMELLNPTSSEKILKVGAILGLYPSSQVIDFGCGFGEALALWGERFGISGVGIDVRAYACDRARRKLARCGLGERIKIVQGEGAKYQFKPYSFDVAACIGASFIWGGFQPSIRAMKTAIQPRGHLVIGEPYWLTDTVPAAYREQEKDVKSEYELLGIIRMEGFDLEYMVRASHDDWDRYEADNWYGLLRWIEVNPVHPERQQVIDHLHESQDEYLRFGRQYLGWAIFILTPQLY